MLVLGDGSIGMRGSSPSLPLLLNPTSISVGDCHAAEGQTVSELADASRDVVSLVALLIWLPFFQLVSKSRQDDGVIGRRGTKGLVIQKSEAELRTICRGRRQVGAADAVALFLPTSEDSYE